MKPLYQPGDRVRNMATGTVMEVVRYLRPHVLQLKSFDLHSREVYIHHQHEKTLSAKDL